MLGKLFILVKLFFGHGVAEDAMQCFGSVRTVTAGSVIAVHSAAACGADDIKNMLYPGACSENYVFR